MIIVDSCGWMHYFMNGDLAEQYVPYLSKFDHIMTPTIVLYEVYKKIRTEFGEEHAFLAASQIEKTQLIPLSSSLACHAADISIEHKISMADAIIYATANSHQATLVTSDADFKGLPNVSYISSSVS